MEYSSIKHSRLSVTVDMWSRDCERKLDDVAKVIDLTYLSPDNACRHSYVQVNLYAVLSVYLVVVYVYLDCFLSQSGQPV